MGDAHGDFLVGCNIGDAHEIIVASLVPDYES